MFIRFNTTTSALNSSISNTTDIYGCIYSSSIRWFTVLSVICFLLGLPASMMVLRVLLQKQRSSDFFMFNLTTSDTIYIVLIPVSLLNTYLWHYDVIEQGNNFMDGLSLSSRPLFMACICAECYFAVVHPIMYMTNKKALTVRRIASVIIWLGTICFSLLKCFATEKLTDFFNATPLFIALPVITFCDISILQALNKTDPSGNANIHPQKKQVFHIIINSFIMTVSAYLPAVISFTLSGLGPKVYRCQCETSGFCFSTTGSVIMPILYLDSVGKLNKFKELWRKYI